MKDETNHEFFLSLSEAEWDNAEALAGLASFFSWGKTEEAQTRFLRAAIETKRADPSATNKSQYSAAFAAVGHPLWPVLKPKQKRRSTLK